MAESIRNGQVGAHAIGHVRNLVRDSALITTRLNAQMQINMELMKIRGNAHGKNATVRRFYDHFYENFMKCVNMCGLHIIWMLLALMAQNY